jgi:hypothetical protein
MLSTNTYRVCKLREVGSSEVFRLDSTINGGIGPSRLNMLRFSTVLTKPEWSGS